MVTSEECSSAGPDYGYFRRIMSLEANAAVLGAFDAGATEVVVRIPTDRPGTSSRIFWIPRANLIRDWAGRPEMMMEGIDETFDAVVFIGYHARAGTADAIIDHTSIGECHRLRHQWPTLPKQELNALMAGHFGVPVVFVAGRPGRRGSGPGALRRSGHLRHEAGDRRRIHGPAPGGRPGGNPGRGGRGRQESGQFQPFTMSKPYTLVLKLKNEASVYNGSFFPGARRTGDWELTFSSEDIFQVMYAFNVMKR